MDQAMNHMKCTSGLLGYIPDSYLGYVKDVRRTNAKRNPKYPHEIHGKKCRGRHLIKVSEYHDGDDLMNTLLKGTQFDEHAAAVVFKNMATCVKELQMANILHRDIKCENFMFKYKLENNCYSCSSVSSPPSSSSTSLKYDLSLIDFGAAKKLENELVHYVDCTDLRVLNHNLSFHAPEVQASLKYSKASDIFSLGVCLWVCLFRTFPTSAEIGRTPIEFANNKCSNELKHLFQLIFESDPSKRLDIDGVLNHEFIKIHCSDASSQKAPAFFSYTTSNVTTVSPPNVPINDHSPLKGNVLGDICKC
jgi:serine/threonine protein kinase